MSANCTAVSDACPVSQTLYGYYPNLGVNAFLTALFGILFVAQVILGVWKKTWTYAIAVSVGCFGELMGYAGRLIMHGNPWSQAGLEIQICCLVLAPSFLAAGVYLTLKHVVIYCGSQHSRIPPKWYPRIFILFDLGSIVIQAIGGGVAASASTSDTPSQKLLSAGDALIIAGIALQVATMAACGGLALDFYLLRRKTAKQDVGGDAAETSRADDSSPERYEAGTRTSRQFQIFCVSIVLAYVTILIRCIYRIHEMAGGWGNPRMRDETVFLILDGMMIALATIALTLAHPGLMFAPMRKGKETRDIDLAGMMEPVQMKESNTP